MTGFVTLKPGVQLDGLQPAGIRILAAVDHCSRMLSVNLTVTCGLEGHGPNDPHTKGNAIDVRAKDLDPTVALQIYRYLKRVLGEAFTVLYEVPTMPADPDLIQIAYHNSKASAPHFHLQPKKGITWPAI